MSTFALPRSLIRLQDRLLRVLGDSAVGRAHLVQHMLRRDASEVTSYWLQMVVAVGIATLGLVVNSGAVVIGAMLIAPLMVPIVGLAMGLATGGPFLVLRTVGRIALSVVVAVGGAALITLMLPYHELNSELAARTSPTVLDLVTAGFCALAGVFASLRPASNMASTAAGTSIGISLVPPLCASGYGLGTADWSVAGGAGLLFLTNMVAIVAVGMIAFVITGFHRVEVIPLERDELAKEGGGAPLARALARRLARLFESRPLGPALRFLMPFFLLALVYIPLGRALTEVAWQVRVKMAVRKSIDTESARLVQSRVRVDRHEVEVLVVILGAPDDAAAVRARLDAEIRLSSGVVPRIEVLAVPDASALAGLVSTMTPRGVEAPVVIAELAPDEALNAARARVRATVAQLWPTAAAGEPLVIDVGTDEGAALRVRVVHLGPALSPDGAEALRLGSTLGLEREVQLVDVAVPAATLTRDAGDLPFLAVVAAGVRATAGVPAVHVCVVRPAPPTRKSTPAEVDLAAALDGVFALHPSVTTTAEGPWSVRFTSGPCAPTGPDDGGAPDAGR